MSSFSRLGDDADDKVKSPSPQRGPRRSIRMLSNAFASPMNKLRRSSIGTDTTQDSSDKTKSPYLISTVSNQTITTTNNNNTNKVVVTRQELSKGRPRARRASLSTATATPGEAGVERAPTFTGTTTTKNKRRSSLSHAPTVATRRNSLTNAAAKQVPRRYSLSSAQMPTPVPAPTPAAAATVTVNKKAAVPRQRRAQSLTGNATKLPPSNKYAIQAPQQTIPVDESKPIATANRKNNNSNRTMKRVVSLTNTEPSDINSHSSNTPNHYHAATAVAPTPEPTPTTKKKVLVRKTRQRSAPGMNGSNYDHSNSSSAASPGSKRLSPGTANNSYNRVMMAKIIQASPQSSAGSEQSPVIASPKLTQGKLATASSRSPQRSPSSQSNNSGSRSNNRKLRRASLSRVNEEKLYLSPESPISKPNVKLNRLDMSPGLPLRQISEGTSTLNGRMQLLGADETEAWEEEDEEAVTVEIIEPTPKQQNGPVNSHQQQQALTPVYKYARQCQWDLVVEECDSHPRDAKCVYDKDGTTALHLAVMSRTNPAMRDGQIPGYDPAPLEVIEVLLMAAPEAAITRCSVKRYTPLHYACLVADEHYDMEDVAKMIDLIIKYAEHSPYVFTDDGFSALDVHILSYSRLHVHREEEYSGARTSTAVIKTLLKHAHSLSEARAYCNKIRSPVEMLYRSNMDQFREAAASDNNAAEEDGSDMGAATLSSVKSKITHWWALKWVILLLKYADTDGNNGTTRPFCALHAAARMPACPTPILSLLYQMNPKQIEDRDPRGELYNLPLHQVCSWRCDKEIVCGDPFVARRKLLAIELLLELHPEAARTTNNQSETPLQLAIESGTTWNGGISLLVKTCPKALKFPRKLRNVADINQNVLSVSLHNQALRTEREEEEFLLALDGMYPFMVAAVFARIPENRRRDPAFLYDGQTIEEHHLQIHRKEIDSLTVVYGLLRTRPDALSRYRYREARAKEARYR